MRKWKTNSGDSIEKFAVEASCNCSCGCNGYTCRPTPTHDVGEQAAMNTQETKAVGYHNGIY